ncbi:DUF3618 domain-containing protein [Streptomyces sp. NPDC052225]|uniref:DUF3618 domain-containing protein n=1 Tax=Streptomyces sp. NPDC052225 TaxID=3154949 RepID=UPI003445FEC0
MSRTDSTPGAKGPEELRRDIAHSRGELADIVGELAERADVKGRARDKAVQLAHRVQDGTPQPVRHATSTVVRAGLDYRKPVLVAAAGAAVAVAVVRHRSHTGRR